MKRIVSINADDLKLKDQSVFILFNELVGTIKIFAGNVIPDGYLLCDGSEISRTSYEDLFNAIGTIYGEGDGSTTFNLPNLIGKFIEGSDNVGNVKSAGLPNITGSLEPETNQATFDLSMVGKGAIEGTNATRLISASSSTFTGWTGFTFDASRCSSVYGNSSTVQPPALTMRFIIKY